MTPYTPEELDRLEALAKAATAGEWTSDVDDNEQPTIHAGHDWIALLPHQCLGSLKDKCDANAAHIAAFHPQAVLRLLAQVRAADARWEELKEYVFIGASVGGSEAFSDVHTEMHRLEREPLPPPPAQQEGE